ncbi:hypothetical protein SAY87_020611 [Trapa incisa]|uniref:PPC domain-containing protein n=1 Tax=Trapa incisa TaxID=236973 RepID=A0AAN7JR03_9MYRT|nr:hypothetical protein SAY87_020611 [Trapa incisa]
MFPKFLPGRHPFPSPSHFPDHDDASSSGAASVVASIPQKRPSTGDGASIEVVRRPRGRPAGSKNKVKPPVVITRDLSAQPSMSPYVLEVSGGNDVIEAISRFCRRKGIGLSILAGSGAVADFTVRQPASMTPGATVTFHGRFEILSISATFLPSAAPFQVSDAFKISLAGPQGQVFGGAVVGPLVAAGPVFVIAATFNSPAYQRLPLAEDEGNNSAVSGSGGRADAAQSPPPVPGCGGHGDDGLLQAAAAAESCGISSMYSCHLGSEVIWVPSARLRQPGGPPAPPPPPY